jgi:hypothetical protein
MEVASAALGIISSLCSILSTAYDIENSRRDNTTIRTAYERLKDGVESIEAETSIGNTISSHCERLLQACDRMSSTPTTYGEERDSPILSRRLGRISRDRGSVWDSTGYPRSASGQWQSVCQKRLNATEPMLWKLEKWTMVSNDWSCKWIRTYNVIRSRSSACWVSYTYEYRR